MRYRDCPTVEVSKLLLGVPTEPAWNLVCDIELPTRHCDGELRAVRWCDGHSGPAVGARFEGTSTHPSLGTWSTVSEIVELEPGSRWVWRVLGAAEETSASWGFEVEPSGRGAIVRQWARMGPGASGLSFAIEAAPHLEGRIVSRRIEEYRRGMTSNLEWISAQLTSPTDLEA